MKLEDGSAAPEKLWHRIAWFVVIWAISIAALGAVAYLLRFWLGLS